MGEKFTLWVGEDAVADFFPDNREMHHYTGRFETLPAFDGWQEVFRKAWACHGLVKKPGKGMVERKNEALLELAQYNIRMVDENEGEWAISIVTSLEEWGPMLTLSPPCEGRVSVRLKKK